jgi:hypothetical protein
MPARVEERPYFAVLRPHDDNGRLADFHRQVIAWGANLGDVAGEKPFDGEDRVDVKIVKRRLDVERARETETFAPFIEQGT